MTSQRHKHGRSIGFALSALILLARSLTAQVSEETQCSRALHYMTEYASRNYSGFADKVNPRTRSSYDALVARLTDSARRVTQPDACVQSVLHDWVAFFRDGHVAVVAKTNAAAQSPSSRQPTPEEIRGRYATAPSVNLTEAEARARFAGRAAAIDGIEGVWDAVETNYRVAIIPRDSLGHRHFDAVVLRADSVWWVPGQIKATFVKSDSGTYGGSFFFRDHSGHSVTARIVRSGVLAIGPGITYVRTFPSLPGDMSVRDVQRANNGKFSVEKLSDRTVLIQLPTFDPSAQATIDSIERVALPILATTENLILDVRKNEGGVDYVYDWLLPYLYTRPRHFIPSATWASDDNIRIYEATAADPRTPANQRQEVLELLANLRANRGGWYRREERLITRDSVFHHPSRVAVLVDEYCASSCEQFVLNAKESDKVIVFGNHTAGALDYASVLSTDTPDGAFTLRYASARSQRLPQVRVDPDGIQAGIPIPSEELLKIEWVQRWLER